MTAAREPRLWDFAVRLYTAEGVEEACLRLQEARQVDVPFLLFGAWLGEYGIALDAAAIDRLDQHIAPWRHDVVHPLRNVRRRLKVGPTPAPDPRTEALREKVKAAELESERLELQALEALAGDLPRPATPPDPLPTADNLHAVLRHFSGRAQDEEAEAMLTAILAALAGHSV